jgi:Family of unknown function (DUF6152)
MRKKFMAICIVVSVMLAVQVRVFAHHGNAAYDTSKADTTLTGIVTEWIVANPHSFLKMDVKNDDGSVSHWVIESSAASVNQRGNVRLTKNSLKPGDKITVTMMVAKNGQPIGRIHQLLLPDGKLVVTDLP